MMVSFFQENDVILFQGDSITDTRRVREGEEGYTYNALGSGYAYLVAAQLGLMMPDKRLSFYNRGIGGNRVVDLQARWTKDCLELKPTIVSIYIGINDCWRRYDCGEVTTVEQFEAGYRDLLTRTKEQLDAKLVLVEPFVLPVKEGQRAWREDLDPKIQVVRELAREFSAILVPLDGLFAQATIRREPTYWAPDGVHPSPAGHALIAEAWLRATGAIGRK